MIFYVHAMLWPNNAPMRVRLRTLMILLAILPPLIAWWGWPTMQRILWPPKPAASMVQWKTLAIPLIIGPEEPPTATTASLPPD